MRSLKPTLWAVWILAAIVVLTGCATTPIGKAVQSAEAQKKLVEAAMLEVAKLHFTQKIPDADYAKARSTYQTWAAAQNSLAASLAAWKAMESTENSAKVSAALQRLGPLADAFLSLAGRFVDLSALSKKVTWAPSGTLMARPLLAITIEASLEHAATEAAAGRR